MLDTSLSKCVIKAELGDPLFFSFNFLVIWNGAAYLYIRLFFMRCRTCRFNRDLGDGFHECEQFEWEMRNLVVMYF